jgi:hypothetical protein
MDKIKIIIQLGTEYGAQEVHRYYALVDGQVPDNMQEEVESMVENLLDKQEI